MGQITDTKKLAELSVEQILDELLSGNISKAEGAQQLSKREIQTEHTPQKEDIPTQTPQGLEKSISQDV